MYRNDIVLTDGDYRVIAVQDDYAWDHTPEYCGGDMMFSWDSRGYDGPWSVCWQGCACLSCNPISPTDILRGANAFRNDLDMLNRWLRIVAPDGSAYLASQHYGNMQGEQYLLVERFDAGADLSDHDPSKAEPVCWAVGDVYRLEVERRVEGDWENCGYIDAVTVYGLGDYAETVARESIADVREQDAEEAERFEQETREMEEKFRISAIEAKAARYDDIAREYIARYVDEGDTVRSGFLHDEVNYWKTKAAVLRATI